MTRRAPGEATEPESVSVYTMVATTGFWLFPLLLSVPLFSRDTYSYLAQGALQVAEELLALFVGGLGAILVYAVVMYFMRERFALHHAIALFARRPVK
mgnify:CR=1 FL=1